MGNISTVNDKYRKNLDYKPNYASVGGPHINFFVTSIVLTSINYLMTKLFEMRESIIIEMLM